MTHANHRAASTDTRGECNRPGCCNVLRERVCNLRRCSQAMRLGIVRILKLSRQEDLRRGSQCGTRSRRPLHPISFSSKSHLTTEALNHQYALAAHTLRHDGNELQTQARAHHGHSDTCRTAADFCNQVTTRYHALGQCLIQDVRRNTVLRAARRIHELALTPHGWAISFKADRYKRCRRQLKARDKHVRLLKFQRNSLRNFRSASPKASRCCFSCAALTWQRRRA